MEIHLSKILATIINFGILYLILKHYLFKPVNNAIDSRQNEIITNINKAEEDRIKAEELRKENEDKLRQAKQEGKTIVEDYKVKADKVSSDILQEARQEAEAIIERAKVEAEREKEKAADEVKTQVVDLAVLLSSKALEESVNEQQHRRLIKDFIAKVGI
ncbi:F0F1 ATP synthase subunit B [Clostridium magnum]|uniref:ATP synthase subunit b n=1 Tax=Clostridium magnum DSM 2767 TaxID=1121326 RepID=A0A161WTA7_9CLOT|nr:F0F1 ATP synthase subunit B [Clostridium magnum]KZL90088.1 ATP synthase subunit b, sodium ion specific [Clostridium magnum DSM 2767]SHH60086.1 ATP synthase F0 subcomplex B subunit [Clostridium magnum DSM 2767]